MVEDLKNAREFLINKFKEASRVPSGAHAIPKQTSAGDAFMRVKVSEGGKMSDFHLFWDEEFKISWYTHNKDGSTK